MRNLERKEIFRFAFFSMLTMLMLSACGKSAFRDMSVEKKTETQQVQPESVQEILEITDEDPRFDQEEPNHDSDRPTMQPNPTPTPVTFATTTTTVTTTTTLPVKPTTGGTPTTTTTTLPKAPSVKPAPVVQFMQITIDSETRLRTLKENVLEHIYTLVPGDVIQIDKNSQPVSFNYRNAAGKLEFASTGFYANVKVLKTELSEQDLKNLNELTSGLFITSIVVSGNHGDADNTFAPLTSREPGEGYQKYFESNGKPKNAYTRISKERFSNINAAVSWSSLKPEEQKKWSAIMGELQKVADRGRRTPRDLLIIERKLAVQIAIDFEQNQTVQGKGAWSVAVDGTARRNGFEDVPCAEFMGEIIRQAYFRAGYKHQEDFNKEKRNILNFDNGASLVANLSAYLVKAGWIPWNSQQYIPSLGAIVMHKNGSSPGHTYMSAGSNGRFIIDNSAPQGRDLRASSYKTIGDMYQTGIFFLPPGFTPETWDHAQN